MSDNVISAEWFERGRKHRYGRANPERFDEPVWEWMEREKVSLWNGLERFGIPWEYAIDAAEPNWWFRRLSESVVDIGDGRRLSIGGYADAHGTDFVCYNDVREYRVDELSKSFELVAIYGYPRDVFPGVHGASATLVGEYVYVIGGVEEGPQSDARRAGVYRLHLPTMRMERVETGGDDPGAIQNHSAELRGDAGAIVVEGGQRVSRPKRKLFRGWKQTDQSYETYELCVRTHAWRLVEDRAECFDMVSEWPRRDVLRYMDGDVYQVAGKQECVGWRGRFACTARMRELGPPAICWTDRGVALSWSGWHRNVRITVKKRVDRRWLRSLARRAVVLRDRICERGLAMIRAAERNGESESALGKRMKEEYFERFREQGRRMVRQQMEEERGAAGDCVA